jgi:hypothetical protein
VEKIIDLISLLCELPNLDTLVANPIVLYFPIHVDPCLRMYNYGAVSVVINKFLRLLYFSKTECSQKDSDIYKRFHLSILKGKIKNIGECLSKDSIKKLESNSSFREAEKFAFYKEKYLLGLKYDI